MFDVHGCHCTSWFTKSGPPRRRYTTSSGTRSHWTAKSLHLPRGMHNPKVTWSVNGTGESGGGSMVFSTVFFHWYSMVFTVLRPGFRPKAWWPFFWGEHLPLELPLFQEQFKPILVNVPCHGEHHLEMGHFSATLPLLHTTHRCFNLWCGI